MSAAGAAGGAGPVPAPPRPIGPLASVLLVVGFSLLWPALQLLVFFLRFGHLPPGGAADALVFLPMGLVAAVVLVLLLRRSQSRRQAAGTLIGYLVAAPLALVGSLIGGLFLPGAAGALVGGAIPLAVGALLGFLAGAGPPAS